MPGRTRHAALSPRRATMSPSVSDRSSRRPLASCACRSSSSLSCPRLFPPARLLPRLPYPPSNQHVPSPVLGLRSSLRTDDPSLSASFVAELPSSSLIRLCNGCPRSSTCLPTGPICPPLRIHRRSYRTPLAAGHRVQRVRRYAQLAHLLGGECPVVGTFSLCMRGNGLARWVVRIVQKERMGVALRSVRAQLPSMRYLLLSLSWMSLPSGGAKRRRVRFDQSSKSGALSNGSIFAMTSNSAMHGLTTPPPLCSVRYDWTGAQLLGLNHWV